MINKIHVLIILLTAITAFGDYNYYVVPPGTPGVPENPDYLSWETAGTNIHEAVYLSNTLPSADAVKKNELNRLFVKSGTYLVTNELVLGDCRYEIRSSKGPAAQDEFDCEGTVLCGGYPATTNRIFNMKAGNAARCCQIRALTVTNGFVGAVAKNGRDKGYCGGGVRIGGAAHADSGVYDCRIVGNTVLCGQGGGVACVVFGGVVSNCFVACNTVTNVWEKGYNISEFGGGGISFNYSGGATVLQSTRTRGGRVFDCIVSNNLATGNSADGSGIRSARMGHWIENCRLIDNHITCNDGGNLPMNGTIYCDRLAQVVGCTLTNNTYAGAIQHAGIACGGCAVVSNCIVTCSMGGIVVGPDEIKSGTEVLFTRPSVVVNCILDGGGWAAWCGYETANNSVLRNCLIKRFNTTSWGAIYVRMSRSKIENCTIVRNYAGIRSYPDRVLPVVNCVFDNRDTAYAQDISMPSGSVAGGVTLTNCYFASKDRIKDYMENTGCVFTSEPGFVDREGGDYRLVKNSPLREAGVKMEWMARATDLDGNFRLVDAFGWRNSVALPDIGCYECGIKAPGFILKVQ